MSKVYVLYNTPDADTTNIEGVVSKKEVAIKYQGNDYGYSEFELNDPELLNRIAKESTTFEKRTHSTDIAAAAIDEEDD